MKNQLMMMAVLMVFSFQLVQAQRSDRVDRNNQNSDYNQYDERYDDQYGNSYDNRYEDDYCPPIRNTRPGNSRYANTPYSNQRQRARYYQQLFYQYDRNNDGRIRFSEFKNFRVNGRKISSARRTFNRYDRNGNNSLSRREFIDVLQSYRF